MDKDMMAKINEALKANDRRELSLDELDKVVGGAGECFNAQDIRTDEELNFYVYVFLGTIEKQCGKDVVADIIKDQFPSSDAIGTYLHGDLDALHNFLGQKFIDRQGTH